MRARRLRVVALALLVSIELMLLCVALSPKMIQYVDLSRAVATWADDPSSLSQANLTKATKRARTRSIVMEGVIWVLVGLNTWGSIRVCIALRREKNKGS